MIAVEKVLGKLLGEYEFVIIPGFGALLCNHIPAAFDMQKGVFSPPFKKLAFNEYLKLDDGTLANYISRHEQLTHLEAVEYVRSYTEKLKNELAVHAQAAIPGIGEFSKNIEGKLVFEPFTENHFKDEWYGFETIRASVVSRNLQKAAASLNTDRFADSEVEVIEEDDEKRTPFRWLRGVAAAILIGLLCGLSFFFVNNESGDFQSTLNPFKELFSRHENAKTETGTVREDPAETIVVAEIPEIKTPKSEDSTPVTNSSGAVKDVPAVAPADNKVVSEKRFYVVAGAFKGSKQANVLLEDLKNKGFENASIIPGTKYSTKFKVATNSFDNEKDAYRASAAMRKSIGIEGWVYKKK